MTDQGKTINLYTKLKSQTFLTNIYCIFFINQVAIKHPAAVTACNLDLENLITDVNRSIATLAITTLLKTGNESSVDRLMKQISTFMSEISDEFKIVVVQAIRSLCSKFPRKHNVLMTFLSQMLRDEVSNHTNFLRVFIGRYQLRQIIDFTYMGSIIAPDGNNQCRR